MFISWIREYDRASHQKSGEIFMAEYLLVLQTRLTEPFFFLCLYTHVDTLSVEPL